MIAGDSRSRPAFEFSDNNGETVADLIVSVFNPEQFPGHVIRWYHVMYGFHDVLGNPHMVVTVLIIGGAAGIAAKVIN